MQPHKCLAEIQQRKWLQFSLVAHLKNSLRRGNTDNPPKLQIAAVGLHFIDDR